MPSPGANDRSVTLPAGAGGVRLAPLQGKRPRRHRAVAAAVRLTTHGFRHMLATSMLERGADTRHVQQMPTLATMIPQPFEQPRKPFLSSKSMKTAVILICIVIAIAIWFWKSGDLDYVPDSVSAVPELPVGQETPLTAQVAGEPELTHQAMNDMQQTAKSVAEKNKILLQLSDKGELVGKRLDDIAKIIGAPTSEEISKAIYRLDTGFGGFEWVFEHTEGVITSVSKSDLD